MSTFCFGVYIVNYGSQRIMLFLLLCFFPGVKWHDVSCNHEKPIVCEDEPGHINFVLGKKWLFVPLTLQLAILSPDRTAYIQRSLTALLGSCGYGSDVIGPPGSFIKKRKKKEKPRFISFCDFFLTYYLWKRI